jgi:hypothetical protein
VFFPLKFDEEKLKKRSKLIRIDSVIVYFFREMLILLDLLKLMPAKRSSLKLKFTFWWNFSPVLTFASHFGEEFC